MLRFLEDLAGTRVTLTRRSYATACYTRVSLRPVVGFGVKATVILHDVRSHLRLQLEEARSALEVGLKAPFKAATIERRRALWLGWGVHDFSDKIRRTE